MKIFHIITTIDRGGAENQLLILAKQQFILGHEVHVFYLKGKSELRDLFLKNKIKIHEDLFMKNTIQKIILFSNSIYRNKPDIIHAHLPESELIARFSIRLNAKFIITRHFGGQFYPRAHATLSSILGKIASKPATVVIAISESVIINLINNREIYDNKKIKLVYYGFSRMEFSRENTYNYPHAPTIQTKIIIGTVSRLSPEKDLATLIKAFHILIKKLPNLELHIVGEGELKDSLKSLCDKLELSGSIKFFGKRPDISYFMSTLSVFVLPSKYEGFGMVLLEAMASRIKIVAAKNSAIYEVIGDKGAGVFFNTSNHDDLADKIFNTLNDESIDYLAEQNNRLSEFDQEGMCNKIIEIYSS
jgi:glycosyltransferase involved in cell wall biosynthesis